MSEEFDKIFKLTGDEDDRGTFLLVTGIALPDGIEIRRLDREMVRPRMHVDDHFEILEGEFRGIYIFEATTRFRRDVYERCGKYGLEQALESWKPVYPYFVIFTDSGISPDPPPPVGGHFGAAQMNITPLWCDSGKGMPANFWQPIASPCCHG